METKISKAQKEVWEWKERLSEELQNLPKEKRIPYILKKTEKTVELLKREKLQRA
jgi:hypothetical protein